MAEYKVSYKLLAQQAEDLVKISTQLTGYQEQLSAIVPKLGEGDLLATAKSNISAMATQMAEGAELTAIAGNTLKDAIGEYSNTETTLTQQAEGTKAHSRDFYKNPVSVGAAIGSDASTATPLSTVNGPMESYAPPGGYGDTVPSGAATAGATDSTSAAGISGAAVAGAVGVAGAAAGAGALFAAKKAKDKKAAKEGSASEAVSEVQSEAQSSEGAVSEAAQKDSYEIELALKKAKEKLESLEH